MAAFPCLLQIPTIALDVVLAHLALEDLYVLERVCGQLRAAVGPLIGRFPPTHFGHIRRLRCMHTIAQQQNWLKPVTMCGACLPRQRLISSLQATRKYHVKQADLLAHVPSGRIFGTPTHLEAEVIAYTKASGIAARNARRRALRRERFVRAAEKSGLVVSRADCDRYCERLSLSLEEALAEVQRAATYAEALWLAGFDTHPEIEDGDVISDRVRRGVLGVGMAVRRVEARVARRSARYVREQALDRAYQMAGLDRTLDQPWLFDQYVRGNAEVCDRHPDAIAHDVALEKYLRNYTPYLRYLARNKHRQRTARSKSGAPAHPDGPTRERMRRQADHDARADALQLMGPLPARWPWLAAE